MTEIVLLLGEIQYHAKDRTRWGNIIDDLYAIGDEEYKYKYPGLVN